MAGLSHEFSLRFLWNIFAYVHHRPYKTVVEIGENILESPETKIMNLPPHVFDVDYVENQIWAIFHRSREEKLHKIATKSLQK